MKRKRRGLLKKVRLIRHGVKKIVYIGRLFLEYSLSGLFECMKWVRMGFRLEKSRGCLGVLNDRIGVVVSNLYWKA